MKKILSLVITVAIVLASVVITVPASQVQAYSNFTVYTETANTDVMLGRKTLDVDIKLDSNPGIWSARLFIVYPDALSLDNGEGKANVDNSCRVFTGAEELTKGNPDVSLTDKSIVKELKSIIKTKGLETEGYSSTTIYFEKSEYNTVATASDVLATLHFTIDDGLSVGDVLDIRLYYTENLDFMNVKAGTYTDPQFVFYNPASVGTDIRIVENTCPHPSTTVETVEPTCNIDGYMKKTCLVCEAVAEYEILPATGAHIPGEPEIVESTCSEAGIYRTYCTVCGELAEERVLELADHIPGDAATCTEAQVCTVCGGVIEAAKGHSSVTEVVSTVSCTQDGYEKDVCSTCGEILAERVTKSPGHSYIDRVCDVCGEVLVTSLVAEPVTVIGNSAESVSPALAIKDIESISYLKLIVYYNKTQLARADDTTGAFDGSVFSEEDSSVGREVAGTNTSVRSFIPTELRSTSNAFVLEFFGEYDEATETNATVTTDGTVINLPLELIASEYGAYTYNVVVAEAYDADGEEAELEGFEGTVERIADPLIGIYDEFTVFADPANADIPVTEDTVDVDIRFDNNPGLWTARLFIVYPDALSLDNGSGVPDITNSCKIFPNKGDLYMGNPDVALSSENLLEELQNVVVKEGLTVNGYRSTVIYFEMDTPTGVAEGDGVVATLHFKLTDKAKAGSKLDIRFYYDEVSDYFYVENDANGDPVFTIYTPDTVGADLNIISVECAHENTEVQKKSATCTEAGYTKTVCTVCKEVLSETVIEAPGHLYLQQSNTVITPPTCTEDGYTTRYCDVCGDPKVGDVVTAWGHDEEGEVVIVESTCTVAGTKTIHCDFCGEVSKVEELPLGDHTYDEGTVVEPTPTEQGYTLYTCTACGHTEKGNFTEPLGTPGDTNLDGKVNAADSNMLKRIMNGTLSATATQKKVSDLNGDGSVNAIDMNVLSKYILGIISSLG